MTIEQFLDNRISRRLKAEERALTRLEKREARAEKLVGTILRDGEEVIRQPRERVAVHDEARNGRANER